MWVVKEEEVLIILSITSWQGGLAMQLPVSADSTYGQALLAVTSVLTRAVTQAQRVGDEQRLEVLRLAGRGGDRRLLGPKQCVDGGRLADVGVTHQPHLWPHLHAIHQQWSSWAVACQAVITPLHHVMMQQDLCQRRDAAWTQGPYPVKAESLDCLLPFHTHT